MGEGANERNPSNYGTALGCFDEKLCRIPKQKRAVARKLHLPAGTTYAVAVAAVQELLSA
jgi:hypothetical protein